MSSTTPPFPPPKDGASKAKVPTVSVPPTPEITIPSEEVIRLKGTKDTALEKLKLIGKGDPRPGSDVKLSGEGGPTKKKEDEKEKKKKEGPDKPLDQEIGDLTFGNLFKWTLNLIHDATVAVGKPLLKMAGGVAQIALGTALLVVPFTNGSKRIAAGIRDIGEGIADGARMIDRMAGGYLGRTELGGVLSRAAEAIDSAWEAVERRVGKEPASASSEPASKSDPPTSDTKAIQDKPVAEPTVDSSVAGPMKEAGEDLEGLTKSGASVTPSSTAIASDAHRFTPHADAMVEAAREAEKTAAAADAATKVAKRSEEAKKATVAAPPSLDRPR